MFNLVNNKAFSILVGHALLVLVSNYKFGHDCPKFKEQPTSYTGHERGPAVLLISVGPDRQLTRVADAAVGSYSGLRSVLSAALLVAAGRSCRLAANNSRAHGNAGNFPLCLQVTARGFAPLLQFAYTAKLLLSRENIQEVIRCAGFLRMHNLEDSCFRFLEAQLRSEEASLLLRHKVGQQEEEEEEEEEEATHSEDEGMQPEAEHSSSPRARRCADTLSTFRHPDDDRLAAAAPGIFVDGRLDFDRHGSSDLPRCPKYRKYQWACNKHNNDTSSDSSTSGFPSTLEERRGGGGAAPDQSRLPVTQIKVEPQAEEEALSLCLSGDEPDVRDKDSGTAMEMDQPLAVDRVKRAKSPSCLRAFFKKGAETPGTPQQVFSNRFFCPQDKGNSQGDHKKDIRPFPAELALSVPSPKSTDAFPAGLSLKSTSCDGVCKQEVELDRRSVIFSSGACNRLGAPAHSYSSGTSLEMELTEHMSKAVWVGASQSLPASQTFSLNTSSAEAALLCRPRPNTSCPVPIKVCPRSPPCETRTRTSSSCSSYSYAEDGSGGSPCSLPQFEFSSSPCSNVTRCLTVDQPDQSLGGDALFNQARPKIKCEQSYGTNSSDESGSFSEGDSESCHVQERGPEVSVWRGRRPGCQGCGAQASACCDMVGVCGWVGGLDLRLSSRRRLYFRLLWLPLGW